MGEYETKLVAEYNRSGHINERALATLGFLAEGPLTHPQLEDEKRTGKAKGNLLRFLRAVYLVHMDDSRPPVYSITDAGKAALAKIRGPVGISSQQPTVQSAPIKDSAPDTELAEPLVKLPEEVEKGIYSEGNVQQILVNRYERDPRARTECIRHYRPICNVCGFDFVKVYGDVMEGFIHVHHVRSLSTLGPNYQIDPIQDLRPVCPNCHAVAHHREPPYSLNEVREFLRSQMSGDK